MTSVGYGTTLTERVRHIGPSPADIFVVVIVRCRHGPVDDTAREGATAGEPPADLFDKCERFTLADQFKASGCIRTSASSKAGQDTEVVVDGRKMLMFGSNCYLELTMHPKVKERAIEAIRRYGTGCAGSRFLNGTLPIHLELEDRLATAGRQGSGARVSYRLPDQHRCDLLPWFSGASTRCPTS